MVLLRDKDISVRRRALDLLYSMCDVSNARQIVSEMLTYLCTADFSIREEIVLKIAVIAEKYATEYSWYVDVILHLISLAGDYVSQEVWFRVVQIITNQDDLQEYAARTVFDFLKAEGCHETAVKVGGYILGEYGHFIANSPGASPLDQLQLLESKFAGVSMETKALLFNTFFKFSNLFPEIKPQVLKYFIHYQQVLDVELQQRACEYYAIASMPNEKLLQTVCDEMPRYPERESSLLNFVKKPAIYDQSDTSKSGL